MSLLWLRKKTLYIILKTPLKTPLPKMPYIVTTPILSIMNLCKGLKEAGLHNLPYSNNWMSLHAFHNLQIGFKLISRFLGEMYVGHFDQTCSLQWPWPHTGEVGNHFAQKLPELWFQGWFVILMAVSMVMMVATMVVSVTSLLELDLLLWQNK